MLSPKALTYAVRDADVTLRIDTILQKRLDADPGLQMAYRTTMGTIPLIDLMQRTGWRIDIGYFANLLDEFQTEKEELNRQIETRVGFPLNPDSGDQVADLLFGKMGMKVVRRTKKTKRPSTEDKYLQALLGEDPIVPMICDSREYTKLSGIIRNILKYTVLEAGEIYGRLYPSLNPTGTPQGRLSSSHPNLLAVPNRTERGNRIRKGFLPPTAGQVLLSMDLSQIELRALAIESHDPALVTVFREGGDIHADTAFRLLKAPRDKKDQHDKKHRLPAKTINFLIPMGGSPQGLLVQLHKQQQFQWSLHGDYQGKYSTAKFLDDWHLKAYPTASQRLYAALDECEENGFVRCIGGRCRWVPGIRAQAKKIREEAGRQIMSFVMSGGAQYFMHTWEKNAYDTVAKPKIAEPILQIHDDLVWGVDPQQLDTVKDLLHMALPSTMPDGGKCPVPIVAEGKVGENWGEMV